MKDYAFFEDAPWSLFDEIDKQPQKACSKCGMTHREYKYKGALGCPSCYQAFKDLVMRRIHSNPKGTRYEDRRCGVASSIREQSARERDEKEQKELKHLSLIKSTRVRLARNVKAYAFPKFLNAQSARTLYQGLAEIFFSANEQFRKGFFLFKMEELDAITKVSLVEKRLISKEFGNYPGALLILSKDERISIMLGEEDHIRIQVLSSGYHLWESYAEAERIALVFEQGTELAFDEHFGFLTACPTNLGTGLRASVMLHLPLFSGQERFAHVLSNLERRGFVVRGEYGENSSAGASLFQLSNQMTVGITCQESLEALQKIIYAFVQEEVHFRTHYYQKEKMTLKNEVSRALALLQNAYLMSSQESAGLLSLLSLGLYYKLIQGSEEALDNLQQAFQYSGVASLQQRSGLLQSPLERDEVRAKYLREWTKDLRFIEEKETL